MAAMKTFLGVYGRLGYHGLSVIGHRKLTTNIHSDGLARCLCNFMSAGKQPFLNCTGSSYCSLQVGGLLHWYRRYYAIRHSSDSQTSAGSQSQKLSTQKGKIGNVLPVTSLKTKRPTRKKTHPEPSSNRPPNVVGFAVGKEFDLQQLEEDLMKKGLYTVVKLPPDITGTVLAEAHYKVNGPPREMFIFKDGAVVCWNMLESERREVIKDLQMLMDQPNKIEVIEEENESLNAVLDSKTMLVGDTIFLNENLDTEANRLEKFAFSNAIAQSVKLNMWENQLELFIDSIEPLAQNLKDGKRIKHSGRFVLRKLGQIFTYSYEINLDSDLLSVPEVYWERESLETLYKQMHIYLNVNKRTRVMNVKYDHCKELLSLINGQLSDQRHVRLEWYIIILIMVEVVFEVVRTCYPQASSE